MSCIIDIKEDSIVEDFPDGIINVETPIRDVSLRLSKCKNNSEDGVIIRKSCKKEFNVIVYTSEDDCS